MAVLPRPMMKDDVDALATLWHDAWHRSHDQLVPRDICDFCDERYFRRRLEQERNSVRVLGQPGNLSGLCIVHGANLDMLFIALNARSRSKVQDDAAFYRFPFIPSSIRRPMALPLNPLGFPFPQRLGDGKYLPWSSNSVNSTSSAVSQIICPFNSSMLSAVRFEGGICQSPTLIFQTLK
jgi:hypothetical protein